MNWEQHRNRRWAIYTDCFLPKQRQLSHPTSVVWPLFESILWLSGKYLGNSSEVCFPGPMLSKTSHQKKASEGYVLGAGSMDSLRSIPGMTSTLMRSQTHFERPWKVRLWQQWVDGFSFVTGTESRHGACLSWECKCCGLQRRSPSTVTGSCALWSFYF